MSDQAGYGYVSENVSRILEDIRQTCYSCGRDPAEVTLMAVTKTVPPEAVNEAIKCGAVLLGENRVQEYLEKKDSYLPEAQVDFIGGLQTNKAKYIVGSVRVIHSVDSVKLAEEINRLAARKGIVQDVLIEVNIGGESSKNGVMPDKLNELADTVTSFDNIRLRGLMTIPPPGNSEKYFAETGELFGMIKEKYKGADMLSMGMSSDYRLAVKYGSTVVRVGTGIFGARNYNK